MSYINKIVDESGNEYNLVPGFPSSTLRGGITGPTISEYESQYYGETSQSWRTVAISSDRGKVYFGNVASKSDLSSIESTASAAKELANTAYNLAAGAQKAISFNDYSELITTLNGYSANKLIIGQSLYIKTLYLPDVWVYDISDTYVKYNFNTVDDFINALTSEDGVQVGYYCLAALETLKINIENLVEKDTLIASLPIKGGIAASDLAYQLRSDLSYYFAPKDMTIAGASLDNGSIASYTLADNLASYIPSRIASYIPSFIASDRAFREEYVQKTFNLAGIAMTSSGIDAYDLANSLGSYIASNSGFLYTFASGPMISGYNGYGIIPYPSTGDIGKVLKAVANGSKASLSWVTA